MVGGLVFVPLSPLRDQGGWFPRNDEVTQQSFGIPCSPACGKRFRHRRGDCSTSTGLPFWIGLRMCGPMKAR